MRSIRSAVAEAAIGPTGRPHLPAGVRLHYDKQRARWVLLAPERVVEIEETAQAVISRCDGRRTIGEIVDDLLLVYAAEREVVAADVTELLGEMVVRGLMIVL